MKNKIWNLTKQDAKIIFLSSLGGALEFYDFVIYVVFAPILGNIFFAKNDSLSALLSIYAIFAIGYFVRPLGGIILSHIGDIHGRKKAFLLSVIIMAVSTGLIGLLPTQHLTGIIATILLITLRILQGFSVGGEMPGAIVFSCEQVKLNRGLACAAIFALCNMGTVMAYSIYFALTHLLSEAQLLSWGWRLPFIIGALLGIFSFYLRKLLVESPLFLSLQDVKKSHTIPLIETIKHYWPSLIQGVFITWLGAVIIHLLYLYLPTYLTQFLSYSVSDVTLLNSINLIIYGLLLLLTGWLSDKTGRKWILTIGALGFMLFSYFMFFELSKQSFQSLISVMLLISILSSCATIYPSLLTELFPTEVRYTGVAISYNLGFAIFGSLTPFIATYLIKKTGNILAPSIYLSISAAICLITLTTLKDKYCSQLKD